jgi:ABC-type glycerol-3-phosphate transport system permease component
MNEPSKAPRGPFQRVKEKQPDMKLKARTAPLSIASLITVDGIEFEYVGSHLILVPPPLLALLARRYIVRGLSLGTVKD